MVRAGHRLGGGVGWRRGVRRGQGKKKNQAGPSLTSSLTSKRYKSGRKYEGHHLYGHKIVECILYYDQFDPRAAQRVRSKRQDERNSTSSHRRRQTSSNLVRVRKVMSGPSARWCRRGCSSGVMCENHLVGSGFLSASGHTRTHAFRISAGEAFRS